MPKIMIAMPLTSKIICGFAGTACGIQIAASGSISSKASWTSSSAKAGSAPSSLQFGLNALGMAAKRPCNCRTCKPKIRLAKAHRK